MEIAAILLVFALHGASPVPEVNEPHYLGKARHFWDPAYAAGDFFLTSHDTHLVFYWTVGWLTLVMPLTAVAWCGRLMTWILLAVGWRALARQLGVGSLAMVAASAAFAGLVAHGHMAGEWVVGGFEAKGLAYGLVLLGLAQIVGDRWSRGLVLMGAASSLHVLVGGWSVVATGVCWCWLGARRPPLAQVTPGAIIGGLLALPGVWPAVAMSVGVPSDVVTEAHRIYVFERLPHHLLPDRFQPHFLARHAVLLGLWYLVGRAQLGDARWRRLFGLVLGAVTITGLGLVILLATKTQPEWAASLLRFYWFRLTDVFVPLGLALALAGQAGDTQLARPRRLLCGALLALAAGASLACAGYQRATLRESRADPETKIIDRAAWLDACHWIANNTPEDAIFVTPRLGQTFKWHTSRGELAVSKDVPQDAARIVEWWQQLNQLHGTGWEPPGRRWYPSLAEAPLSRTLDVGRRHGASYLLTLAEPPLALPQLYRNSTYAVYALPANPPEEPARESPP